MALFSLGPSREMSLETAVGELELARLMTYERKLKRVQELVYKRDGDLTSQQLENKKILKEYNFVEQLEELVELNRRIVLTLKHISDHPDQVNISIIGNIQKMARDRDDRLNEAVELVYNLLDCVRLQKSSTGRGH